MPRKLLTASNLNKLNDNRAYRRKIEKRARIHLALFISLCSITTMAVPTLPLDFSHSLIGIQIVQDLLGGSQGDTVGLLSASRYVRLVNNVL